MACNLNVINFKLLQLQNEDLTHFERRGRRLERCGATFKFLRDLTNVFLQPDIEEKSCCIPVTFKFRLPLPKQALEAIWTNSTNLHLNVIFWQHWQKFRLGLGAVTERWHYLSVQSAAGSHETQRGSSVCLHTIFRIHQHLGLVSTSGWNCSFRILVSIMAFLGAPGLVLCPSDHNAAPLTIDKIHVNGHRKKHETRSAEACREGNWDSIGRSIRITAHWQLPNFSRTIDWKLVLKTSFRCILGPGISQKVLNGPEINVERWTLNNLLQRKPNHCSRLYL